MGMQRVKRTFVFAEEISINNVNKVFCERRHQREMRCCQAVASELETM